jgi:rhamnosyltransferase
MKDGISVFPKILAYITAYQAEEALLSCLQAVNRQSVSVIHKLVVDNSPSLTYLGSSSSELSLIHHPENIGVGGGMALALQMAFQEKYDFVWLLDQDSMPVDDCLERLLETYYSQQELFSPIGIVAPLVIDKTMNRYIGGGIFERYRFLEKSVDTCASIIECDAPIISGSLLAVSAARTVGLPQVELFLDGVDLEYGLRLKHAGFRNLITTSAILNHHLGSPMQVSRLGQYRYIHNYSTIRSYYYYRNHTYLDIHFSQSFYKYFAILYRCKVLAKEILLTLLYRDKKLKRIYASTLGSWHGFKGISSGILKSPTLCKSEC